MTATNTLTTTATNWLDAVSFNEDGLIPAIAQDKTSGRILMMAWMNADALQLTAKTKTAVYFSRSRGKLWHKGETSGHTQQVHDIHLDCDADVIVLTVTQIGGIACHTGRESCFYRRLDVSQEVPTWTVVDPVLKDPNAIYGAANNTNTLTAVASQHRNQHLDMGEESQAHKQAADDTASAAEILSALDAILISRKQADADSSYVASLYHKGLNKILEKVGEESVETIIAAKELQQAISRQPSGEHLSDALKAESHEAESHEAERHKTGTQLEDTADNAYAEARHELIYEVADVWFHTLVTLAWFNIGSDEVLTELARRFGLSGLDEKAARAS